MEPLMIGLAFLAGIDEQLLRLPPLVGFLAAGFVLNAGP
jgi:glutathione-regulated potassium-efflux system ancillary protein KefC